LLVINVSSTIHLAGKDKIYWQVEDNLVWFWNDFAPPFVSLPKCVLLAAFILMNSSFWI